MFRKRLFLGPLRYSPLLIYVASSFPSSSSATFTRQLVITRLFDRARSFSPSLNDNVFRHTYWTPKFGRQSTDHTHPTCHTSSFTFSFTYLFSSFYFVTFYLIQLSSLYLFLPALSKIFRHSHFPLYLSIAWHLMELIFFYDNISNWNFVFWLFFHLSPNLARQFLSVCVYAFQADFVKSWVIALRLRKLPIDQLKTIKYN